VVGGGHKLENARAGATVHIIALWVAGAALVAKELLFRYMLAVAKRVKSSMLVANAWHARSDAASSLVVGIGIAGNLAGYPILDPIAALIVGFMVAKMGWELRLGRAARPDGPIGRRTGSRRPYARRCWRRRA
jgi:divalent metal cation (Fe/Co/Zn/Cd) transporter